MDCYASSSDDVTFIPLLRWAISNCYGSKIWQKNGPHKIIEIIIYNTYH